MVMMIVTSRAQLTKFVGSTWASLSPTDATCGRTSVDSYCLIDMSAKSSCVFDTCWTLCEDEDRRPAYSDLLRDVSGFNYDGSVTNTTMDFGGGNVTVAVFNRAALRTFLKGTVDMRSVDEFTLTFLIRPDDMDTER